MRVIKFLILLLLTVLFNSGIAQIIKFGNLDYSHVPIVDGNVMINWGAPTSMKINFTFTRPSIEPWVSKPIKGELVLYYDANGSRQNLISTNFTTSDWDAGSFVSHVITRDVTFPANVLNGFNGYLDVYAKYRYYKDKYPDPENTDGWTDWYNIPGNKKFVLAPNTIPVTSFEGPAQICNEGIYTITNPYAISLVNATNIATLTDLGLNKYKITRIGNSTGTIILRSTASNKTFDYYIKLNSEMNGIIDGPVGIKQGWNDNYFYFKPEPGMDYTNVNWSVDSPHLITTQVDKYTFKISVPTNYPLMDKGRGDDVEIYIRSNGECGVMEKSRILRILPARPIKN